MNTYELHPLCTLFPRLTGAEFEAMRDDIAANGLRESIVLHDGMILDGGNRYAACVAAGVEPTFKEFDGSNIVGFVLSANLHRRHMTAGQQAAIVASAQDWAKAQPHGGDRKSDQGATLHLETAAKRSAESGASLRTQKMADKVAKADPGLALQVAHGAVSLPAAVEQVTGKRPGKATTGGPSTPPKVGATPKKRGTTAGPPPKTAAQTEAEQIAEDAHGDTDLASLCEQQAKEIAELQAVIAAAEADDPKAEAMKWRRIADVAARRQEELQRTVVERENELRRHVATLRRIGRAVGEDDPSRVAATVEQFVRMTRDAA